MNKKTLWERRKKFLALLTALMLFIPASGLADELTSTGTDGLPVKWNIAMGSYDTLQYSGMAVLPDNTTVQVVNIQYALTKKQEQSCTQSSTETYTFTGSYTGLNNENATASVEWTLLKKNPLGHQLTAHAKADPTCTTVGYSEDCWECETCKKFFKDSGAQEEFSVPPIIPADHLWDNGTVTTAATCTHEGEMTYHCTVHPDQTKTTTIPVDPEAHLYDNGTVTRAATCTAAGEITFTCTEDPTHTKTETIAPDPNAHAWNEGTVTTAATCTTAGVRTFTCTLNPAHTKTEPIAIDDGGREDLYMHTEPGAYEDGADCH